MSDAKVHVANVLSVMDELQSKYELIIDGIPSSVIELIEKELFTAARCLAPAALLKMKQEVRGLFLKAREEISDLIPPVVVVATPAKVVTETQPEVL